MIHTSALAADAWATALTVLGPADGMPIATTNRIAARLVTLEDGMPVEHITPALVAMLADD